MLVQMTVEHEAHTKSIVDTIEKESVTELSVERLSSERKSKLRQRAEAAEKQVADLQKVLDRMYRGEFPVPITGAGESASAPGTSVRQVRPAHA